MKTLLTREFYISGRKATLAHARPEHGLEIYYYQGLNDAPCALYFTGRAQKPVGECYYASAERREALVLNWLERQVEFREERKAARREQRSFQHTLKGGDLLHASWGWEQTNNEYYQVVAVKGKSVILREVAQKKEYSQSMSGTTRPIKDHFIGEPFSKRVLSGNCVKISSYAYASLCNENDTHYFSEYA